MLRYILNNTLVINKKSIKFILNIAKFTIKNHRMYYKTKL